MLYFCVGFLISSLSLFALKLWWCDRCERMAQVNYWNAQDFIDDFHNNILNYKR